MSSLYKPPWRRYVHNIGLRLCQSPLMLSQLHRYGLADVPPLASWLPWQGVAAFQDPRWAPHWRYVDRAERALGSTRWRGEVYVPS